jgi:3-deoxy-7-phosphoheptulonate synthase
MLIVMTAAAKREEIEEVVRRLGELGCQAHVIPDPSRSAISVTAIPGTVDPASLGELPGVLEVIPVAHPFKLVTRDVQSKDSVVDVRGVRFGGGSFVVIAGPCAVESAEQAWLSGRAARSAGAQVLRGGAFKPRTSPYSFQGLGEQGLKILHEVGRELAMPVVSEAMDERSLELVLEHCDIIQIGSRNMANYSLLRTCGRLRRPVLLKRGMAATVEEFLLAAEYLMAEGNSQIILCERGVRNFGDHSRNALDLAAILEVHRLSHLPIIADPSHATGRRYQVAPMARAAAAAGADGVMVEVHHDPSHALSDGPQAIQPGDLTDLVRELETILTVTGKQLAPALPLPAGR